MMDVKKLVVGFLVLAVATSASALMISGIGSSIAANNTAIIGNSVTDAAATTAVTQTAAAPVAGNAFVPKSAAQNSVVLFGSEVDPSATSSLDAVSNDPNNLTNILASNYLNGLVSTNPSGPATDAAGNPALTPPDNSLVIAQLASSSALKSIQIPNWDTEAAEIPITSTESSSVAIANYTGALQNIFNQQFVQTNLESLMHGGDPASMSLIGDKIKTALGDIAGLQTPQPVMAFQKSLLKMLVYEKNAVALVGAAPSSTDPLRIALVFQGEEQKYEAALQSLNAELKKASTLTGFSLNTAPEKQNNQVVAFIENVVGIKTAHAQFAAIVFDPDVFGQMIIDYLKNIALQILKNFVIHLMQRTVLSWIQGSGAPRIIQSWGTTLVNAYTLSAVNAIDSQMSCINGAPFSDQLRLTLKAYYKPGNGNVCAVQFQSQLRNNLTKFYNNFSDGGGWLTYGATMQPDNNYYGSVFFTAQVVGNTAQNAQSAAQAKNIAGQGFKGSEVCADGSNPNGSHETCADGSTPSGGVCADGGDSTLEPNGGLCANGKEPQVTSPGQVTGQVFNTAVQSGSNLVTAANDIVGLLNALLTSFLNSLATDAITAANGALP